MVRLLSAVVCFVAAQAVISVNAQTAAAFDAIGQAALDSKTAAGFSYVVLSKGQVVYSKGFGLADVNGKVPVTADTRFAVGSVSKQFTAAAILLLAEDHKLTLDDPLAKYLPKMPNAGKITLRMLLNQTSGLHNYPLTTEHNWPLKGATDPQTLFDIMATDKPDFEPGTKWEYSNTNYASLAGVVVKASGMSYPEFLQKRIFVPLGMNSSGSGFAVQPGIATAYKGKGDLKKQENISLDLFYGAGSVISTANDLAKWDEALMTGKLLNVESMHSFWTPGKLADGKPVEYAMGFLPTQLLGHREIWHNGLTPGAGGYTYNAIFPDDRLAVIVLSNGYDFRPQPEKMVEDTLRAFFPDAKAAALEAKPGVVDDPIANALARLLLAQMQSGKLDAATRSRLTPELDKGLTPELIEQMQPQIGPLGAPTEMVLEEKTAMDGGTLYVYAAQFAPGNFHIRLFMTADGKAGGIRLVP